MQQVFDPGGCLIKLALSTWPERSDSVCLRFIDPWGDTVFNHAQIPELLTELIADVPRQHEREIKAHLEKVVRLVKRAVGETHTYIKFIGD